MYAVLILKKYPVGIVVNFLQNENVDLQTIALHFINCLLTCCNSMQEYKKRYELFRKLSVPEKVKEIEKTTKWDPLITEILTFRQIEQDFSSSIQMEAQFRDITDLYNDAKNEVVRLTSDIKFYKYFLFDVV